MPNYSIKYVTTEDDYSSCWVEAVSPEEAEELAREKRLNIKKVQLIREV
jgi:hypothetical protein